MRDGRPNLKSSPMFEKSSNQKEKRHPQKDLRRQTAALRRRRFCHNSSNHSARSMAQTGASSNTCLSRQSSPCLDRGHIGRWRGSHQLTMIICWDLNSACLSCAPRQSEWLIIITITLLNNTTAYPRKITNALPLCIQKSDHSGPELILTLPGYNSDSAFSIHSGLPSNRGTYIEILAECLPAPRSLGKPLFPQVLSTYRSQDYPHPSRTSGNPGPHSPGDINSDPSPQIGCTHRGGGAYIGCVRTLKYLLNGIPRS